MLELGSNAFDDLGTNVALVKDAVEKIKRAGFKNLRLGHLYATPAFPAGAGPDFVNACATAESPLSPTEALAALHAIEAEMGRVRTVRWGQRVIDLDLLAAGDRVMPDVATFRHWMGLPLADQMRLAPGELIVPHPRLHERGFVLVPLADVAPDWVHPILGRSVRQMLAGLDPAETAEIRPI
ncbi:MAG: 2-amino-4-hydroxy-6-hydroxymethyldihydropteridine diphosphokinase [Rhodobacteraceae bacterium]|nr:2-amino-4-hydroxy-6-hydroxymethyldihydropteridine diphosphokinase [Paracoccaceae bacterium]